ncbi:MAG: hypothetical protein F6K54_24705 [Okeania sp. SIO3B5]|uniref:hypothetical protein n=1 Tax=Okeania sp. SIO3B5 TaxID=2607811 RepID=UPI001400A4D9|nr:hypothetical protein [Okeania sp. SIO3B5]NEO55987.1 hypothetical protein [Okeania sp. SIO3B5]
MGRWGDGEMEKYLVMVEDGTFFYTELNGFDITIGWGLSPHPLLPSSFFLLPS